MRLAPGFLLRAPLLTQSLERSETLAHPFKHRNLLAEGTAPDRSALFFLARQNVRDVRIDHSLLHPHCRGSARLGFRPQLETLDLAGRGFRKIGAELDPARIFVGRER